MILFELLDQFYRSIQSKFPEIPVRKWSVRSNWKRSGKWGPPFEEDHFSGRTGPNGNLTFPLTFPNGMTKFLQPWNVAPTKASKMAELSNLYCCSVCFFTSDDWICFSKAMTGLPDEFSVGICPVCVISRERSSQVSLVIRKCCLTRIGQRNISEALAENNR